MSVLSFEDPTVDQILEAIDVEMADQMQPKVLLFDIGGVCVSDIQPKLNLSRLLLSNTLVYRLCLLFRQFWTMNLV